MKYYINGSFSIKPLNNDEQLVVCNDIFRKYECDANVLKNVIGLISKHNNIECVYEYYNGIYDAKTIDDFIGTLIDENVIIPLKETRSDKVSLAILGERNCFDVVSQLRDDTFCYSYFSEINELLSSVADIDGVLILPGEMYYGEALAINKALYATQKPFAICRYTGEDYVIGPLVFPWKTTCLECHSLQHLMILNEGTDITDDRNSIKQLKFSRRMNGSDDLGMVYALQLVLQDMEKICDSKANFQLINKEFHTSHSNLSKIITKHFACTTECTCCHAHNKNYIAFREGMNLSPPAAPDLWKSNPIKYSTGGLRSVSADETEQIVSRVLSSMVLEIQIKQGVESPISEIIPVHHSVLEMSHKNNTPYFFDSQHSYGKGINPKQAYFSAAFEMFERISARYFGEKEIVCGKYYELKDWCADIDSFVNLHEHVDTVYDKFDEHKDIDWVWSYSIVDGKAKLIPASLVFLSKDVFKGNFAPNGSSGMSSGATIKDAILQGLFELLEHDAWMIGQANTVRLPIVSYEGLQNAALKNNIARIIDAGYNIISRDYTNDIGIPVIRTWISNPKSYVHYATSGLGASIYPEIALERSITEAVQSGAASVPKDIDDYSRPLMKDLISARDGLYSLFYFQQKDIRPIGYKKDIKHMHHEPVESVDEAIKYVISRIKAVDPKADVLYVDFTRESIGIPAVKVFVTSGVQILREPLLSTCGRLMNFQKNMGYSETEVKYDELYMAAYPH